MEEALQPGSTLNERYRIEAPIGAGGMGRVYRAYDERLGRPVAIKVLPQAVARDPDRVRRFVNEARAVSALNHPNILTIHEVGTLDTADVTGPLQFMVTEFIDGQTLRAWLTNSRRDPRREVELMAQIATAVAKAHAVGVIHRDLKPENVMVTSDGHAKVLDFGLAKLMDGDGSEATSTDVVSHQTRDGVILGTTAYLSPEQAEARAVDHRSDIFALGLIFYEMVSRRRAFEGSSMVDTLHRIIHSEARALTDFDANVSLELQRIVRKCMAKSADDRYQNANELALDLRALGREFDSLPRSSAPVVAAAGLRRRPRTIVVATAVLVLLAIASVIVVRGRGRAIVSSIPRDSLALDRLTTSGAIENAAISPDGKYLVYTSTDDRGLGTMRLMQVATRTEIPILLPGDVSFGGVEFSNDGTYIYFARRERDGPLQLYRIPTIGGSEARVLPVVLSNGTFAVSPDDRLVAFYATSTTVSPGELRVAPLNGGAVRVIARRTAPDFFRVAHPAWSADGRRIAFMAGSHDVHSSVQIHVADVDTSAESVLGQGQWSAQSGGQLAWIADGRSLLLAAPKDDVGPSQLWRVDAQSGAVSRITNDLDHYTDVSLAADGRGFVSLRSATDSNLWVGETATPAKSRRITSSADAVYASYGLDWAPDGRIVYMLLEPHKVDLWSLADDGTHVKRLTDGDYVNLSPAVSPDGSQIAFSSDRGGAYRLCVMQSNGQSVREFTNARRGADAAWSADGRSIFYASDGNELWRTTALASNAVPARVTQQPCLRPAVSPDGRWIICLAPETPARSAHALLVSADDGKSRDSGLPPSIYRWMRDGRIAYRRYEKGVANIWSARPDGSEPRPVTQFDSGRIFDFDFSPDEKRFVVSRANVRTDAVLVRNFQ